MIDMLLNFFYPPVCGICGKKNKYWICDSCFNKLKINIVYEKEIKKNYNEIIYLFKYSNIRNLILRYKFGNQSYLYNTFSSIILKNKNLCRKLKFYDIIIPVPMFNKKKKRRGYNQTELISKKLSKFLGILVSTNTLIKIKNTKTQSTLKEKSRYENVKNAFCIINDKLIKNKNVILFDDIITTGATIEECSIVLKEHGAKNIIVLAIAKD
ncbi:MAG: ComF family protein [Candidatus Scatovivens sp.]